MLAIQRDKFSDCHAEVFNACTGIPRLTSEPAKEFFGLRSVFFLCFLDSANEYGFG
jgi:hypothetical protein